MRLCSAVATVLAFVGIAYAQSPFVGTWKMNRDKTQFDANSGILKIEADGQGIRYSSAGTAVYGGPLDGTERPGLGTYAKDTFVLKKNGDRGYETVQSRNGKYTVREVIEASPDGKTLTSSFTQLGRKDGKQPTTVNTYKRTSGDGKPHAFLGTWKRDPKLTKWGDEPTTMVLTDSGGVLTMNNTTTDLKTTIDLAKGTVALTGGNPATDVTRTAKKIDDRCFEMSTTRGGRTQTSVYRVAPDGKTMTVKFTCTGEDGKPVTTTNVFERQ
jgi:hypothetical protein